MREKMKGKLNLEDEGDTQKSVILLTSSEDEEANEDLSLKIVEKARVREMKRKRRGEIDEFEGSEGVRSVTVIDLSSSSCEGTEAAAVQRGATDGGDVNSVAAALEEKKNKKKKKKKKKNKIIEQEERNVDTERTDEHADMAEAVEAVSSVETEAENVKPVEAVVTVKPMGTEGVERSDNIVLRKLLRGPRYFDPPGSSWDKCYNCGKEGHAAVNCVSQERKKPCFVCGSFEHQAKHCPEGQYCYICKKNGHRKKDCPEKHQKKRLQSSNTCLRCGDSGHDMFSCRNDYSSDDLKGIQCYICEAFGHFCCTSFIDTGPRVISCYNCGQTGHTGLGCAKSRGETSGAGSPRVCYKCGEEGHIARGCTKYSESSQRISGFSTPRKRSHKEGRDIRSAPHNLGRVFKKKSTQHGDVEIETSRKSKRRGGWITDDPGDLPNRKSKANGRWSPITSDKKGHKISKLTAGGVGDPSSSRSPWKKPKLPPPTPGSRGSSNSYQPRFNTSRLGSSSVGQFKRNYGW